MSLRPRDVVVVGASAGGVEALRDMVGGLPGDLPAAILVVLHMPAGGTSTLPSILQRVSSLPVAAAIDGMRLDRGRVYVARPDYHLLTVDNGVALSTGPTENGHRPAINALFRSAAVSHGPAAVGVLLSGVLDDGVAGLGAIAAQGGMVVVQDPDDALYPAMPRHALAAVAADHVVPANRIGEALAKITATEVEPLPAPPDLLRWENAVARGDAAQKEAVDVASPSEFSCPDCNGVLAEVVPGRWYRCRVGHAWSAEALLAAQGSALERALWTALRSLDEKTALNYRMAQQARGRGSTAIAKRYEEQAEETITAADEIRRQLGVGKRP